LGVLTVATRRRSVIVSILFTVFGGPGIVLIYVPYAITRFRIPADEPLWQTLVAGVLIFVGLIPLFDSILRFIYAGRGTLMPTVPTEQLVVTGLYRYVRNPMYVGVLTALAGEAVLFWRFGLMIEAVVGWLAIELFVRFYEEPTLAGSHSEDYLRYRRHVPRWLPRLTPWLGDDAKQETAAKSEHQL
jgi:protein-S-isoprenylcysteine O-methyltransferase Ste14